jgi:hypothetical protein
MNAVPSPSAVAPPYWPDEPLPLDEASVDASDVTVAASALPLSTRFLLGGELTPLQVAFLDMHGFLVFAGAATPSEVETLEVAIDEVQKQLLKDGVEKIRGVPVWIGTGHDGQPMVQRQGFTSLFSDVIHEFVTSERFEPIRRLIGETARVGHDEMDGVVLNRYVRVKGSLRPGLGWHTDGLRDLFYGRLPKRMLNVGFHFDRIRPEDGGLRMIPGTHTQGFWKMLTYKLYFASHAPDKNEIAVETWPGDLTVHDGRAWHRVQASPHTGEKSLRRSMYVPYLTSEYDPRDGNYTPLYQRVFDRFIKLRKRLAR